MSDTSATSLLLGRDRARTRRYLGVALVTFVATLGAMGLVWVAGRLDASIPVDALWLLWAVALVAVGLPTLQAYRNDGLLVSVALGVAIPLAFYLVLTGFDLVYPTEDLLWGVGAALQFGVPAGALGFALGAGGRRFREWRRDRR